MKHWAMPKKAEEAEKDTPAKAAAQEKPISVRVSPRPLLDVPVTIARTNPNVCLTVLSTILTAAVLGLCFVVAAIPPLYLDDAKGRRIYVGVMIPLLTLLCTVLLYYIMQQPQRVFNTAMVKMVKEMEHHSTYLSTAVDNVEKELNARGVSLSATGGAATSSFGGRLRSHLATPEDFALHRSPVGAAPLGSGARGGPSSSLCAIGGSQFLHGIDDLEESQDVVIATVHVGKEWRWFKEMLGKVKATSRSGGGYPGLAYQRVMVNAMAPLNLWNTCTPAVGAANSNRLDMHARAAAALARPVTADAGGYRPPPTQRIPLRLLGASAESLSESTFTLINAHTRGSEAHESEAPAFSTNAALEIRGDDGTFTELTPPSATKGFTFDKQVRLPQFSPLLGSGEIPPPAHHQQLQQQQQPQTKLPAKDFMIGVRSTTVAPLGVDAVQRRASTSTSGASPALQRADGEAGENGVAVHSEPVLRSASDDGTEADVDVEGVATPLAKVQRERHAASGEANSHSIVVVKRRSSNAGSEVSPISTVSTQQPLVAASQTPHNDQGNRQPQGQQQQQQQTPRKLADVGADKRFSSFDITDAPFSASPPPVKPPLSPSSQFVNGHARRQPGTAVVSNPSLTLLRGARFVNDEDSFFMTILVHVRKARLTCFSRLYAAQAHVQEGGTEKKFFFANTGDSSFMRRSVYNPLTLYHISDVAGEREGLTVQEERLLSFVYCRPEHHSEMGSADRCGATDLSSLAVKGGLSSTVAPARSEGAAASPSSSVPQRATTNVYAEEVDAFILAMDLLANRPMRLTFLPVHVEAVAPRGLSRTGTGSESLTSLSLKATATSTMHGREGAFATPGSEAGVSNSEPERLLPPLRTVPVLECVINDVLCVVTKMEITVDASLQKASEVLLIGVSLEDVSEGSERGVDDVEEEEEEGSGDLDSLADAQETKRPTHAGAGGLSSGRHARSMATPQAQALGGVAGGSVNRSGGVGKAVVSSCTVGQEFREVINMESDSVTAEPSLSSA